VVSGGHHNFEVVQELGSRSGSILAVGMKLIVRVLLNDVISRQSRFVRDDEISGRRQR
jgi:hypothetical protein